MSEKNWYVLFVMGGREATLCQYLNKEAELFAFCPKTEVAYKKNGAYTFVLKPMFPSYIFVETNVDQGGFQTLIREIRSRKSGIVKELKFDNEDTPALSSEEREFLEKLLNRKHIVEHSSGFIENDKVVITDGPLKGYESHIVKIDRHKREAVLAYFMLGKEMRIKVSLEIVKKIGIQK